MVWIVFQASWLVLCHLRASGQGRSLTPLCPQHQAQGRGGVGRLCREVWSERSNEANDQQCVYVLLWACFCICEMKTLA